MSTLKVGTIQDTSGSNSVTPSKILNGIAKAWVNFNGTGTVSTNQTIRADFNVSSVFKNGTGDYTVNFTNAMVDGNYAVKGSCQMNSIIANLNVDLFGSGTMLAGSCRVRSTGGNASVDGTYDSPVFCIVVFR